MVWPYRCTGKVIFGEIPIGTIYKSARLKEEVDLHPHQEHAVKKIEKNRRGLIAHATGLGKTLTSIAAFERLKDEGKASRAIVIAPASLRENYIELAIL